MVDQVGKYNMNNTLLLQNEFSVNAVKEEECQEDDFVDDKVQICETAIITELDDNLICDKIKQYDVFTTLGNIKTELSLPEIQYNAIDDNLKMEERISTDNIKIEFNNELLYCEDCHAYYEDYCAKCGMLVQILNGAAPVNAAELPNKILKIQNYSGESHVFALKVIPVGVNFGPFTGLNGTERSWKIKGGKFVVNKDKSADLNWMHHINPARNISARNLLVFQYGDNLYYQSTRQIQEGDELLLYFGEEYDDSLNRNVEMDFVPTKEHIFKDAFACTFCWFGFSSKSYLAKHKTICPGNIDRGFSVEELMQCPSCKIHLDQKEYILHHTVYCRKISDRKSVLPITGDLTEKVNGRKTPQYQMYICQQCVHKTKYKEGPKNHTNEHYEAKIYKCEICCGLFHNKFHQISLCLSTKTEGVPRAHMKNTHIRTDGNQDRLGDSTGIYMNAHTKAEQSRSQGEMKQLKCSKCEFRTKYKRNLRRHLAEKHLKKCNYKCDTCDFKAYQRYQLKNHIETKHLQEFKYKCDTCSYKTTRKSLLELHTGATHLKEFKYKCDACDYKTNWTSGLKNHMERRHLTEFYFNCDACDYKTHVESNLKKHKMVTHLKIFEYRCDSCDYTANQKAYLKMHIETKHLKVFKHKCEKCDYKTNVKSSLKSHIETIHLKEFKYKCDICDYKANQKSELKIHIQTMHLKEFKYKCDTCDYKSNRKGTLKKHIETRHVNEFKYKCDKCDYKASIKWHLRVHIEASHSK